jgi:arginyl-tRNA synthetase
LVGYNTCLALQANLMKKILLEYVSANPNATLNLLHARSGVVGDVLANLLTYQGNSVLREFYVNDHQEKQDTVHKEAQARALDRLGVAFDSYISEDSLYASGQADTLLARVKAEGKTREQGGALWLKTSEYGDSQDRVLVRLEGDSTYFLSDLAYHVQKFERGFDIILDIWDSNHAEYVTRTRAGLALLGLPDEKLQVLHVGPVRVLAPGSGRSPDAPLPVAEVLGGVSAGALRLALMRTPTAEPLETTLEAMVRGYLVIARASERVQTTSVFNSDPSPIADAFAAEWERAASQHAPHLLAQYGLLLAEEIEKTPHLSEALRDVWYQTTKLLGI